MRILTVRQPWAWAIIHGGKDVENRVRNIAGGYRGPVLIHVAKAEDMSAMGPADHPALNAAKEAWFPSLSLTQQRTVTQHPWREWFGHIIGVVDLVDVHAPHSERRCGGVKTEWSEPDAWHLVMQNPRALDEPIPYKGALGLRKTEFFVSGDWLGEYVEPCKSPCAGVYGCPPSCYSEPVARLVATS